MRAGISNAHAHGRVLSSLGELFSGEGPTLLVNLHSVALDADLSGIPHGPISQCSHLDSRHIGNGTRESRSGTSRH